MAEEPLFKTTSAEKILALWDKGIINQAELISSLGERPDIALDGLDIPEEVKAAAEGLRQAIARGEPLVRVGR